MWGETPITRVHAVAFRVPTDGPEADGTLTWDSTVIVVVNVEAGGMTGLGYTYSAAEAASLINATLAPILAGKDIWDIPSAHRSIRRQVRNMGASGIAATAISAVDAALWDLKARLLDLPLARMLGMRRSAVPVYGSGGFTNYDNARLRDQLASWEGQGCRWVKIKVGTDPDRDPQAHQDGSRRDWRRRAVHRRQWRTVAQASVGHGRMQRGGGGALVRGAGIQR